MALCWHARSGCRAGHVPHARRAWASSGRRRSHVCLNTSSSSRSRSRPAAAASARRACRISAATCAAARKRPELTRCFSSWTQSMLRAAGAEGMPHQRSHLCGDSDAVWAHTRHQFMKAEHAASCGARLGVVADGALTGSFSSWTQACCEVAGARLGVRADRALADRAEQLARLHALLLQQLRQACGRGARGARPPP